MRAALLALPVAIGCSFEPALAPGESFRVDLEAGGPMIELVVTPDFGSPLGRTVVLAEVPAEGEERRVRIEGVRPSGRPEPSEGKILIRRPRTLVLEYKGHADAYRIQVGETVTVEPRAGEFSRIFVRNR